MSNPKLPKKRNINPDPDAYHPPDYPYAFLRVLCVFVVKNRFDTMLGYFPELASVSVPLSFIRFIVGCSAI